MASATQDGGGSRRAFRVAWALRPFTMRAVVASGVCSGSWMAARPCEVQARPHSPKAVEKRVCATGRGAGRREDGGRMQGSFHGRAGGGQGKGG